VAVNGGGWLSGLSASTLEPIRHKSATCSVDGSRSYGGNTVCEAAPEGHLLVFHTIDTWRVWHAQALDEASAISEGGVTDTLKNFLQLNMPKASPPLHA
jgi:hypothetical protein